MIAIKNSSCAGLLHRGLIAAALSAGLLLASSAATAPVASARTRAAADTLQPGATLRAGQSRSARNRRFRLVMQRDGNLVLYRGRTSALWSSQTGGNRGARAVMQRDGNLVVYSPARDVLYATGTTRTTPGRSRARLVVQGDGNAVIYTPSRAALWTSKADVEQLRGGQSLRAGQSRRSRDGRFRLEMQKDGNLALYEGATKRAVWSAQTGGNPGASAALQSDGNLVVLSVQGVPLSVSATKGQRAQLVVQGDGQAVLYAGGSALWTSRGDVQQLSAGQTLRGGQSRASANGRFVLAMQKDGNLVLREAASGKVLWASQTGGNPGAVAALQVDGNLVVRVPSGAPLFASASQGDPRSRLLVQDDGNLVLYSGDGAPLWAPAGAPPR